MATAITDSSITGVVTGAYGDLVKLDDGRIINLATYLKEQDDGGTQTIVGILKGAYESQVQLSDGSIKSLSEHVRNPGALTIAGIISGAYISQAKVADGMIVNLAEKVKADEGGGSALEGSEVEELSLEALGEVATTPIFPMGQAADLPLVQDTQLVTYNGNEYLVEKLENEVFVVSKKVDERTYEPISPISAVARGVVKLYRETFEQV